MKIKCLAGFCAATFLAFAVAATTEAEDKKQYILSVVPQLPPVTMYADWIPVTERLSKETGLDIRLKVYEKMDDFETDVRKGGPDFVLTNPTQIVEAHKDQGYIPLVRSAVKVSGIAFVRKDSPIKSLQDLNGKVIAFLGKGNLCSVLIRHSLSAGKEKVDFEPLYAGSSANVLKDVMLGKASAGATLDTVLSRESEEVNAQLRVIFATAPIAPHPLSAHPRVTSKVRNALTEALLGMWNDGGGRELLVKIRMPEPVRADYSRDYKQLEKIDIKRLTSGG